MAEWGRARFGGADVPAERRLADLESTLAQVKLDPADLVSVIAPLLDIPLPPERAPKLSGEELRRRQLAALTNWVMASAKVQPVVLTFEDLHWADPTTLDVLKGIAEQGALAPLLIVTTTRPEFRPPWSMRINSRLPPKWLDKQACLSVTSFMSRCQANSLPWASIREILQSKRLERRLFRWFFFS